MKGKQEEIDKIKKQLTDSPDVALPSQDQFILNLSKVNQSPFKVLDYLSFQSSVYATRPPLLPMVTPCDRLTYLYL